MSNVFSDRRPSNVGYQFLSHISGASADDDLTNMGVSGAGALTAVFAAYCTGNKWNVERVNITVVDGNQTVVKFGGLAALTNGVQVAAFYADGTTAVDFMNGAAIKANYEWAWLAGTDNPIDGGAGDDALEVRWTISKGIGGPLALYSGEYLGFVIRDDIEGLTEFRAMVQGKWAGS